MDSNSSDVVTCCLICDINHDGLREVLIGTYGQVINVFFISVMKKLGEE